MLMPPLTNEQVGDRKQWWYISCHVLRESYLPWQITKFGRH